MSVYQSVLEPSYYRAFNIAAAKSSASAAKSHHNPIRVAGQPLHLFLLVYDILDATQWMTARVQQINIAAQAPALT